MSSADLYMYKFLCTHKKSSRMRRSIYEIRQPYFVLGGSKVLDSIMKKNDSVVIF